MSARTVIGSIIIFFAVLGIIINISLSLFVFLQCNNIIDIVLNPDCSPENISQAVVSIVISLVVGLIWVGIGLLIRGKTQQTIRLG